MWVSWYTMKECAETATSSESKRTIAAENIKVKKPPKGWAKKAVTIGEDGKRALSITDDVAGALSLARRGRVLTEVKLQVQGRSK